MPQDENSYLLNGMAPEDFSFKPAHGTILEDGTVQVSGMNFQIGEIGRKGQILIDYVEIMKGIAERQAKEKARSKQQR